LQESEEVKVKAKLPAPPTDGGGFRDFYHNRTNSILQQLKRNFRKIAGGIVPNFNND
jgi:hypothetical protein